MNTLLTQSARVMRHAHQPVRHQPVDFIPIEERRRIVESMLVHAWRLGSALRLNLGRLPTIVIHDDVSFNEADVMENLSRLHVDIVSAYNALGTADAAQDGFEEVTDSLVVPGAHPNFRAIIDELKNPSDDVSGD